MGLFGRKETRFSAVVEHDAYQEKTIVFELYVFASGDVEEVAYCKEHSYTPKGIDKVRVLRDFDGSKSAEITMRNVTCVVPREETKVVELYRKRRNSGWFSTKEKCQEWVDKMNNDYDNVEVVQSGVQRR